MSKPPEFSAESPIFHQPMTFDLFQRAMPNLKSFDPDLIVTVRTTSAGQHYYVRKVGILGVPPVSVAYQRDENPEKSETSYPDLILLALPLIRQPVDLDGEAHDSPDLRVRFKKYLLGLNSDFKMVRTDNNFYIHGMLVQPDLKLPEIEAAFALVSDKPAIEHTIFSLLKYISRLQQLRRSVNTTIATNITENHMKF